MLKQFLSKLPRKSPKSENADSDSAPSFQRSSSVNAARSNGVKRTSSAIFPSSVVAGIEPLLSFKDVLNPEKQSLFLTKANLCCVIFDFSDPDSDPTHKDLKRRTLSELVDFVSIESSCIAEPIAAAICMVSAANLFRVFPPNYRFSSGSTGGEAADEDDPVFDPAWPHLEIVYNLLLRFVSSTFLDVKIAKKYINHSFILRLLDLFDSEDPRERECLKMVLHRIYGKFMVHRPFIRKAVNNVFYQFVFETQKHNGIAELLEIFGSVISGFALPLKEEHKMFLWRALIPLHKPKSVGVYMQQLTFCTTQFVEKEPKLASTVIRGLLKYWPVTSSQKELMFLGELEEVLEATSAAEFQKCVVPLLRQIGYCLNSSHFQVAERALLFWNNDHIVSLIAQNRQVVLPIIVPALEKNTRNHWNQTVLNLTLNVRKIFQEMDDELLQICQSKYEEEEIKLRAMDEKRRLTWERLESFAGLQTASRNTAVPLTASPSNAN